MNLRPILTVALVAVVGFVGVAHADAGDDLLRGPIDPYQSAAQRARFLRAAGVDTELSAEEFEANQKAKGGFVQPFDDWKDFARFDKNNNGTIDWFEADACRKDQRERVFKAFDADENGKLDGAERDSANATLAKGKLPGKAARGDRNKKNRRPNPKDDPAAGPEVRADDVIKKYDKDGDGMLNDEERAAMREESVKRWREEHLKRWDKNGNGKIDEDERKAMREHFREERRKDPMFQYREKWITTHFDEDGDGQVSDEERHAFRDFEKNLEQLGKNWRLRFGDLDGDGKISDSEKQTMGIKYGPVFIAVGQNFHKWMDANGDETVSEEERRQFQIKAAKGMTNYFDRMTVQFDTNNDGRLSAGERQHFIKGVDDEFNRRFKAADKNGNDDLDAQEMQSFIYTFLEDTGVKPKESKTD